jgi:hypothetical protein
VVWVSWQRTGDGAVQAVYAPDACSGAWQNEGFGLGKVAPVLKKL